MSEYKIGGLSDLIQKSAQTNKNQKQSDKEKAKLSALFSTPRVKEKKSLINAKSEVQNTENITNTKDEKAKQKKKDKKTKSKKDKSKPLKSDGYDPPPGIVHESILQNENSTEKEPSEVKKAERKTRHKNRRDRTKDPRTVFVGNLPITFNKKELIKLFKQCGKIESVRFRCPPPADLKLPKRAIAITKSFHKERHNIISYVCFEDETGAHRALNLNGQEIDGYHIRVDISTNAKKHDNSKTIFIGNMTYDITEDEVWSHFEDCGEIENVRIIRDNKTGTGKGIGYIQFQDKDSTEFALKLHESTLKGRQVRVMRCDAKTAKKQKIKMLNQKVKKPVSNDKHQKKLSFRSTNKQTDPFQYMNKDNRSKHFKKKHSRPNIKGRSNKSVKTKNKK